MSAAYTPTTHRVKNLHNGNYISKRTALVYLSMARQDRANGWAKALDAEANNVANNKHVAAMRYYLANGPTLGETYVRNPHNQNYILLRTARTYQVMAAKDRVDGWARADCARINTAENNKPVAAKRFAQAFRAAGVAGV